MFAVVAIIGNVDVLNNPCADDQSGSGGSRRFPLLSQPRRNSGFAADGAFANNPDASACPQV
jgi:hypothetical protein